MYGHNLDYESVFDTEHIVARKEMIKMLHVFLGIPKMTC